MTEGDVPEPDELDLLRREAAALGMPGPLTPEAAGITATTPEELLARIRDRESEAPPETEDGESDADSRAEDDGG